MGLRDFFSSLRRREREEELERAELAGVESPEEQLYSSGDIERIAADQRAAGTVRMPPGSIERLGE